MDIVEQPVLQMSVFFNIKKGQTQGTCNNFLITVIKYAPTQKIHLCLYSSNKLMQKCFIKLTKIIKININENITYSFLLLVNIRIIIDRFQNSLKVYL